MCGTFFSTVVCSVCVFCQSSPMQYSHGIAVIWDFKRLWGERMVSSWQWDAMCGWMASGYSGTHFFIVSKLGRNWHRSLCENFKSALHYTYFCQSPRINLRGPIFIVPYVQIVRTHTGTLWPLKHYNGIAMSFPPRPSALWERHKKAGVHWTPTHSSIDGWHYRRV